MKKLKVGIIFGGMSSEHDVSITSALNIIENIDNSKYEKYCIYISTEGTWYNYDYTINTHKFGEKLNNITEIKDYIKYLQNLDIIFPVLHGKYGEDGSIQGLCEFIKKPYVGCGILASSLGMDKVYTKMIFEKAGIAQAKSIYIKVFNTQYTLFDNNLNEKNLNLESLCTEIEKQIKYPMFVKPSNSGSSVGISKATNKLELEKAIQTASLHDCKILIEQGIVGKEVECAVLGNNEIIASTVGEIIPADDFYSYDAKYNNPSSYTKIPADISEELQKQIQDLAIKAFKAIDGKGLSRVDFFVEQGTNKIYLNEINTMPGFTNISMYPCLMNSIGFEYSKLIDELIRLGLEH